MSDPDGDPRSSALSHGLRAAGHEVRVVRARPARWSIRHRVLRRVLGSDRADRIRIVGQIRRQRPDLIQPMSLAVVPVAREAASRLGVPISGWHTWPGMGPDDYVWVAPRSPQRVPQAVGGAMDFHSADDRRAPYVPEPGRHSGKTVAVYHRSWRQSPGEHVTAALQRAGVEVVLLDTLDWDVVGGVDGVFLTESPLPALEVRGENPGVPVAFWVHHGEIHLPMNLRLAQRYGAHHVLLAHSWHLAYRFSVPVHRFPFAVAPELLPPGEPPPWAARSFDAALVGIKLYSGGGDRYRRRQEIVASVEAKWPADRLAFREGVTRDEVMRLYRDSRVVFNDGGPPHQKLTDRVFEAFGAGALLLTDPCPGLDVMFRPGEDYVDLAVTPVDTLRQVLAEPDAAAAVASSGREAAMGRHTYDHRVDDLFAVFSLGTSSLPTAPVLASTPLGRLVSLDDDSQRLVQVGSSDLAADLPDREVWSVDIVRDRLRAGAYDAVAVAADHESLGDVLEAARRFVYAAGGGVQPVLRYAGRHWREAQVTTHEGGTVRVDRLGEGYRMLGPGS